MPSWRGAQLKSKGITLPLRLPLFLFEQRTVKYSVLNKAALS
jgi:hypothetical protein